MNLQLMQTGQQVTILISLSPSVFDVLIRWCVCLNSSFVQYHLCVLSYFLFSAFLFCSVLSFFLTHQSRLPTCVIRLIFLWSRWWGGYVVTSTNCRVMGSNTPKFKWRKCWKIAMFVTALHFVFNYVWVCTLPRHRYKLASKWPDLGKFHHFGKV